MTSESSLWIYIELENILNCLRRAPRHSWSRHLWSRHLWSRHLWSRLLVLRLWAPGKFRHAGIRDHKSLVKSETAVEISLANYFHLLVLFSSFYMHVAQDSAHDCGQVMWHNHSMT